mmetsp:Transcript_4814/g.15896  ORF Transcript_4814/g.15896 Transcript_4814/m.15896 type:complete len:272 (+) Transcript_4814:225-1040(+)
MSRRTRPTIRPWPVAFLVRHLLEACSTYEAAVRTLAGVGPTAATGWTRGGARLLAPCYVLLVGSRRGEGCLVTCEAGRRKHVRLLRDDGVLATANCDSIDGCDELPAAAELHAPFTPCTAKDEMQGESLLRRDLALRALRGLDATRTTAAEARPRLLELLRTSPIGNESTVHESLLCAGRAPHLASSASPWPDTMRRAKGLLEVCCRSGCERPTWYVADMVGANSTRGKKAKKRPREVVPPSCYNGSLPKRRGSLYYCEQHALAEGECSVR